MIRSNLDAYIASFLLPWGLDPEDINMKSPIRGLPFGNTIRLCIVVWPINDILILVMHVASYSCFLLRSPSSY